MGKTKETAHEGGDGEERKVEEKVALHKLFSLADSTDVALMVVGGISAVAAGFAMPLLIFLFSRLVNSLGVSSRENVLDEVTKVVLQFIYLAVGACFVSCLQVSCWIATGERQATRISTLYLKAIIRQDISFFDKETNIGEVIVSLSGDTILIQDAMGEKVGKFINQVSMFVGSFIVSFIEGWNLTLVMMCSIPFVIVAGAVMSLMMSKLSASGQLAYLEAGSIVEETVGSIRTVASFSGERQAIRMYNGLIRNAYKSVVLQAVGTGVGFGALTLIIYCSYGLAVWYGARLTINGGYNGGNVISIVLAVTTGAMSLGETSPCLTAFSSGQVAAHKMFAVIHRKPDIDAYEISGMVLEDFKGDIKLRDVYFSYPARPDHLVFKGFSLHIPSGTTMALVGESGSGKSTVVSLVERFYDPQAGEVLIDGVNLKNLKLRWIREKIGLVGQEPVLFTTTIRENISYGKEGANVEEVMSAAELANAAKFIEDMPNGLETRVGEHGTQLSGGQKQRIAIARAILRNPNILLLDEATSALDGESEQIVQDALMKIMVDRTTIIVAHRLSTVKNANTISVLQEGRIVEQGSHLELIKNSDGVYSKLVHLQDLNVNGKKWQTNMITKASSCKVTKSYTTHEYFGIPSLKSLSSSLRRRNLSLRLSFHSAARVDRYLDEQLKRSLRSTNTADVYPDNQLDLNLESTAEVNGHKGNKADQEEHTYSKERKQPPIWRLAYLNRPEIPVLVLGSFAAAVNGLIYPLFGIIISSAIKTFYEPPHQLRKHATFWSLMYVILGVIAFFVAPLQRYFFGVAGGKLIERLRSLSFERTVHQEISWFDDPANSSGVIGARLSSDAVRVNSLVGDTLSLMVQTLSTISAGLVIAFAANWELSLVILAIAPLLGLQGYIQMKALEGFISNAKVMYEEASQVASDSVSNIRTVASFCGEDRVMATYQDKCKLPIKQGIRKGIISGLGYGFSIFVLYSSYALCYYVGARFIRDGKITSSEMFRVFFALSMTAVGVSQTSALGPDVVEAKLSTASIFSIIDRVSKIDASISNGVVLADLKGEIEFQHVSFYYPTRSEVKILKDFCLRIPSLKTIALVGESGSGKSTVISLIERFYDPVFGLILIDGVEIQKLKLSWLRQQLGLVSQEPVMFNGSIRSNIAFGKQGDASEDEIIAAANVANAHGFISSLSQGYDTNVGEKGVQLSGGQKQRIAIARAMIRNPRILLLDEATSALDAESEHVVQQALNRASKGRTTISIAHRLSTIKGADIIAVVKGGMIAEQGQHEELMSLTNGAYASLVALHMA
ncbi:hypothetical protein HPP92_021643 [Vanilla planifolia]|uniref:Uncharacterized protein n=1 Tax=Vanilla planifolia TaxID=51239 RepID=A0A835PVR9_VANPL|nr:hypothetical protein HPP92_021643 [Vanilla planifolia]